MTITFRLFAISLLTATLGSCLFFSNVSAYNVASQTTDSASENDFGNESWGQSFVPTHSGTITSVDMYLAWSLGAGLYQATVYAVSPTGTLSAIGGGSSNITVSASKTLYSYTWASNNPVVTSGVKYWIALGGRTSGINKHYGSTSDIYSSGAYCRNISNNIGDCTPTSTLADAYFQINTDNNSSTPSSIDFHFSGIFPTSTCDFALWPVDYTIGIDDVISYGGNIGAVVEWGTDELGQQFSDNIACAIGSQYISGSQTSTCYAPNYGVKKTAPLVPGYVYYAYPYIKAPLDTYRQEFSSYNSDPIYTIAEGAGWSFIVSGQPNENGCQAITQVYPEFSWPFTTTTFDNPYSVNWCDDIDESGFVGQVKSAFCQAGQYLFRPSQSSLENFYSLKDQLSAKPPFGYVTVYSTALDTLSNATSTTSTLSTVTSTAELQLSTWSQIEVFSQIRTAFEWFLYFVTGVWIFNRLRKLSLHG